MKEILHIYMLRDKIPQYISNISYIKQSDNDNIIIGLFHMRYIRDG